VIFKDGGRRHLGFSKIQNFNDASAARANIRHPATFHQNWSKGCRDMAILRLFFKMAAVRVGPPTITTWWSLSFGQIWLKSMQ